MTVSRNAICRCAYSALLIAAALSLDAFAAPAGEVTHVSGALMVRKADGSSKILAPQSKVDAGDLLATAGGMICIDPFNKQLNLVCVNIKLIIKNSTYET